MQHGDRKYLHAHFEGEHDMALALSADGAQLFKRGKADCWFLMLVNLSLPIERRTKAENLISVGIIPGPQAPRDLNSFLEPLVEDLQSLEIGIPCWSPVMNKKITLRAYLLFFFGDMPAVAKLMCMHGHNAKKPCRVCMAQGSCKGTTYYLPLRSPINYTDDYAWDPRHLPIRDHDTFLSDANKAANDKAYATSTGISQLSILSRLSSIRFPASFPLDLMHLIFLNVLPNLWGLYSMKGKWQDLLPLEADYRLGKANVESVAKELVGSSKITPSSFGRAFPDIDRTKSYWVAENWAMFGSYVGRVALIDRFKNRTVYQHFLDLSDIINDLLALEIASTSVEELENRIAEWVKRYEE